MQRTTKSYVRLSLIVLATSAALFSLVGCGGGAGANPLSPPDSGSGANGGTEDFQITGPVVELTSSTWKATWTVKNPNAVAVLPFNVSTLTQYPSDGTTCSMGDYVEGGGTCKIVATSSALICGTVDWQPWIVTVEGGDVINGTPFKKGTPC